MNRFFKDGILLLVLCLASGIASVNADELQTLKNLERERSSLIGIFLDSTLSAEQRNQKISAKTRRLVDLERLVLRDSRLYGNTDILVRRAFKHYDMTFLAHASVEQQKYVSGHWFDLVGLSNEAILNAKRGLR